jgi:hypothetical protein
MFSAGLPKLFQWVDLNLHTSGFLGWYLTNYFMLGRTFFLASHALKIPPLMAEAADYAAPAVELIGFAALLVSRKTWLLWITALICFHLANILILNISFHDYVLIYLVFVDWTRLRVPASLKRLFSPPVIPSVAVLALVVIHTIARLAHRGSTWVFITKTGASEIWDLYVSLPVCALALAFFVHAALGEFHDKRTARA